MGLKTKTPLKKTTAAKVNTRKAVKKTPVDAGKATVETVAVRMKGKTPRHHVTFEGIDSKEKITPNESTSTAAATAVKRAAMSGIVNAKKRSRKEEEEAVDANHHGDVDEEESETESIYSDSGSDENLSELADDDDISEASDEEAWENPFEKAKREGTRLSYEAIRLRFLPPEFQEPQLFKFLSQFGAEVLNCFCVRSRRTHQSKGIAYVQFDNPSVHAIVVEECHGMSLGGHAVQAKVVTLHRPMPSKEKIARRRQLAYLYKTQGAPLSRHDVRTKNPIAALIKYARVEKANNEHLKRLGIDYEYCGFASQLAKIPKELIIRKKRRGKNKKDQQEADHSHGQEKVNKHKGVESTVVSSPLSPVSVMRTQQNTRKLKNGGNETVKKSALSLPVAPQTAVLPLKKRRAVTKK